MKVKFSQFLWVSQPTPFISCLLTVYFHSTETTNKKELVWVEKAIVLSQLKAG